jgi:hypothetical protein
MPAPLTNLALRAPEAGRIRFGMLDSSHGRPRPVAIDKFRFTSPHRDCIERLADIYGGQVTEWNEPKAAVRNQWQVFTDADRIHVYLPQGSLSQWYELWSGGGCQRRCDGVTVKLAAWDDDGNQQTAPCICTATGREECKPTTRLTVLLPELPFYGTWRLESKSWNAMVELPGMADLIEALTAQAHLVDATLGLERRTKAVQGKTRHFVVPTLAISTTAEALAAGSGSPLSISATGASQPALPAPTPDFVSDENADDEDVVDAEIVSFDPDTETRYHAVVDIAKHYGVDSDRLWRGLCITIRSGDIYSLEQDQLARIDVAVAKMRSGDLEPIGFNPNGTVQWATRNQ